MEAVPVEYPPSYDQPVEPLAPLTVVDAAVEPIFDAVFIGCTHFYTTNLGIWSFFDQETYIHIVAQETSIIRK